MNEMRKMENFQNCAVSYVNNEEVFVVSDGLVYFIEYKGNTGHEKSGKN